MSLEGEALAALPIFPLPDVVLFPGAMLPLHVFEPRYREMTADVLAGRRLMGIARLRAGYETAYQGRPAVFEVAGVGYVVEAEQLPDGRSNLLLRGVGRVAIEEELPPQKSYRQVRARRLIDTRSSRPEGLAGQRDQLVAICDQLSTRMREGGDMLRELVRQPFSPAECADAVAAALVVDPDARQRLLETLDPADRLEDVIDQAATLVLRFGAGTRAPN